MDWGEISKNIWAQFATVANTPIPFFAALLFAGWLIWLAFRHTYATRLENLQSTVNLRDTQLQDYKDKLSGASAEEAKQRIDALEAIVASIAPRKLSDAQLASITRTAATVRGGIFISTDMA